MAVAVALFVVPVVTVAETAEQKQLRQHSVDVTVAGCAGLLPIPVELAVD